MQFPTKTIISFFAVSAALASEPEFITPQKYLAFSDLAAGEDISPFSGLNFSYFHLEDFEDGSLNTPGVTLTEAGDELETAFSDSVDGDDGAVDGVATGTQSLWSSFTTSSFTFNFSRTSLESLPTHAGIVWTDVGRNNGGTPFAADLVDNVTFEAFGPDGGSLGVIGPFSLGDGSISQTTDEDRFLGVVNLGGITAIRISMDGKNNWEVDHLQYGFSNPDPEISITREPAGDMRIDYIGILEVSSDLAAESWSPVVPTPPNPYVFEPTSRKLFFRSRRPN